MHHYEMWFTFRTVHLGISSVRGSIMSDTSIRMTQHIALILYPILIVAHGCIPFLGPRPVEKIIRSLKYLEHLNTRHKTSSRNNYELASIWYISRGDHPA
jgi:hypothetical protein